MKMSKEKLDRRMNRFTRVCRESGAKLTHQRIEIYKEVAQASVHPDAEQVYRSVRERMPTISQDTVYRTLWWLKEIGLIETLGSPRERTRFDANLNRHHHFVCTRCGLIQDFYSAQLDHIKLPESVTEMGHIETAQVEVNGVCIDCVEKKNNNKRKGG